MITSWRRKKASRAPRGGGGGGGDKTLPELIIPSHFRCPISLETMKDPVTMSTGITYDRENIEKWIEEGNITCPVTNQVFRTLDVIPNHNLRRMIQDWCVENWAHGVERIPTPRIPISEDEVSRILEKISISQSPQECKDLVGRIIRLMKETDRNKKCIVGNRAASVFASTFDSFAEDIETMSSVLEDVVSGLTLMMPFDSNEVEGHLKSARSLQSLVWFLRRGGLSERINATIILKVLISNPKSQVKVVETLVANEGGIEGLVKLIKEPICPSSTKASLVIIYHIISSNHSHNMTIGRLVKMGLVSLIIDILVDADKSTCEKSLGVLDAVCRCDLGRDAAYDNALIVPVVVKKILRISDLATEFSVSILWRLCDNETRETGGVIVEALRVGTFQKLLLILQVGWNVNERSKDKVTKLLKLLNQNRGKIECTESTDFKNLKRSF